MIETNDLGKRFDNFTAVHNVNLNVGVGEVLALLGPNGAGKTTTVRMLCAILKPTSGWARVAGFDVLKQPDQVRNAVGVLTENHGLYNRMPARDYLDFFGELYRLAPAVRQQRGLELLTTFGLLGDAHRPIGEFSKGMRQKLALARSLLHNPPVLLLDEPTSAMDPESARLVRDAIHDLRSNERTIIICTHNLAEAEELADQIAIIRRGTIIAHGSSAALKERLLGPVEYELRLTADLNGYCPALPAGATLTQAGPDWFRYQVSDPRRVNPLVLQAMLADGLAVLSLQEAPRSLEQVYLQAMAATNEQEIGYVR
jgi:ABC-2 type transport system ATP-binding protein